jgi:hypothetical protein
MKMFATILPSMKQMSYCYMFKGIQGDNLRA